MSPKFILSLLLTTLLAFGAAVRAEEGSVTISAPLEGTKLDAMESHTMQYMVVPGPRGDHVHLYVDGDETAVIRQLEGSYPLPSLASGKHEFCIKVVNRGHVPIGVERCVHVTVE